jgi:hypothetical protein
MDPLLFTPVAVSMGMAAFVGLLAWHSWREKNAVRAMYGAVALKRGWRVERNAFASKGDRLLGMHGSFLVAVEPHVVSNGKSASRYTRYAVGGLAPNLAAKHKGVGSQLWGVVAGDGALTGDTLFDDAVRVEGDPVVVAGTFDHDARRKLRSLLTLRTGMFSRMSAWIDAGELVLQVGGYPHSVEEIEANLELALDVAGALAGPGGPWLDRVATVVRSDPALPVRLRALEAYLQVARPGVHDALLRELLDDPSISLRLRAAGAIMDPEVLRGILRGGRVHEPPDRVRAAAAIEILGEKLVGDAKLEAMLLTWLDDPAVDVARAAADALGAIGTVRAVPKLRPLCEGLFAVGMVPAAAQRAIERIQARLGPVETGSLALSGEAGTVAVVEERGRTPPTTQPGVASGIRRA